MSWPQNANYRDQKEQWRQIPNYNIFYQRHKELTNENLHK